MDYKTDDKKHAKNAKVCSESSKFSNKPPLQDGLCKFLKDDATKTHKFNCHKCDFRCNNKYNFSQHLLTPKHKKDDKKNAKKNGHFSKKFVCERCKKGYTYRQGLYKHKKLNNCSKRDYIKVTSKERKVKKHIEKKTTSPDIIKHLIEQNKILKQMVEAQGEANKANYELTSATLKSLAANTNIQRIGDTNINNINNKISINVFLNEKCKNAMNITDFVDNIKLSFEDIQEHATSGSAQSISDILIKHLTDLKPTERPIHCSDKKRLHFYVKDEDKWEKDVEHEKIDESIRDINNKQLDKLHEWTKANPDWMDDEKKRETYFGIVKELAWMSDQQKKNKSKIKRKLAPVTEIKSVINIEE